VKFKESNVSTDATLPGIAGLLARSWWVLVLRGILAIVVGVVFTRPSVTLATVVLVFGLYALVEGTASAFTALSGWSHRKDRWLLLLEGTVGICAGFVTLRTPGITAAVLIFFIAIWALVTGVLRIVEAIRLRREIGGEVWLALSGFVSLFFAILIMRRPATGALALVWMIGGYALILGATEVMLGLKLRSVREVSYRSGVSEPPHRRVA
jgi:uncharacterized membrane protein HdeD (DUF308 family)